MFFTIMSAIDVVVNKTFCPHRAYILMVRLIF